MRLLATHEGNVLDAVHLDVGEELPLPHQVSLVLLTKQRTPDPSFAVRAAHTKPFMSVAPDAITSKRSLGGDARACAPSLPEAYPDARRLGAIDIRTGSVIERGHPTAARIWQVRRHRHRSGGVIMAGDGSLARLQALEGDMARATSRKRLPRTLGALHITFLGIGGIIGTGIFVLTAEAAQKAGPGMMLSFGIAGLVCAVAALCYAELAAMIPGRRVRLHVLAMSPSAS